MKRSIPVILVALAAFALALPATAFGIAAFRTPDKAAYCGLTENEGPPYLICWTPNDGFTVYMSASGRTHKRYDPHNRGWFDPAPGQVLGFGQSWHWHSYSCQSARSGLTCRNRAAHGWWLGRFRGYRIF